MKCSTTLFDFILIRRSIIILTFLYSVTQSVLADEPIIIPETKLHLKESLFIKDQKASQTSSFSRKKIESSLITWLSDFLKREQSVVQITNNTTNSSQVAVSMRGFGDNAFANSLIVVDGFPLINPSALSPAINAIAMSDIERVDINPSSAGVLWGNQAVGGVLDILTRHPEKAMADAVISYGNHHKTFYNMLIADKFSQSFFFKLSGFGGYTDNDRDYNQQSDQGLSAQMGMDYPRGSLTFNTKWYDDRIELPGILTQQQYDTNPHQADNSTDFAHVQTQLYQLIQKQDLGHGWLWETRLAHNKTNGDGFFSVPYTRQDRLDTLNPTLTGTFLKTHVLLGYLGQSSHFSLQNTAQQAADARQNDVYGQTIIPILNQVDLTVGGRMAWENETILHTGGQSADLNHRLFVSEEALTYHPTSDWDIFIKREGNFRFPKASEMTGLPPKVNPLLPQTGVSYEMGTKWNTARSTTQFSLYQLNLADELAFDPTQTAAAPLGTYSNLPKTIRKGITLSEHYKPIEQITLQGQLNGVDPRLAEGLNNGKQIPAVPNWVGNLGVEYRFKPHWQAHYNALYTGSRYASTDISNVNQKLSGYWLSNMGLQYFRKSIQVGFEIENAFNQKYPLLAVYKDAQKADIYYPGAGRSFWVTLKFIS